MGNLNPFRYRGYYYDTETNLYYLKTRYYDPAVGRFISADNVKYLDPDSINGLNLYAYCNNNPVMYVDDTGTRAVLVTVFGQGGIPFVGHSALFIKTEKGWDVVEFTGRINNKKSATIEFASYTGEDLDQVIQQHYAKKPNFYGEPNNVNEPIFKWLFGPLTKGYWKVDLPNFNINVESISTDFSMQFNGKYHLLGNNCAHAIQAFLKYIGYNNPSATISIMIPALYSVNVALGILIKPVEALLQLAASNIEPTSLSNIVNNVINYFRSVF